jgi:hypothetical protein
VTILDDILDASTDASVPAADLLRKVQIAAHRLGADEIVAWAKNELGGYALDAPLPKYREMHTNVKGQFAGYGRSFMTLDLSVKPDGMENLWTVDLRQPLVELQSLANAGGDGDPTRPWSALNVTRYEESGVFRLEDHDLFSAWNVLTKQSLLGVIDIMRSRAMEFALDLQTSFPEAGSVGGPTVESTPEIRQAVFNIVNNITGDGANVANGPDARQTSNVNKGDEEALREKLEDLGLGDAERDEFVAAIKEEKGTDGPKAKNFIQRVQSGGVKLATSVTSAVAVQTLVALATSYLGIHS